MRRLYVVLPTRKSCRAVVEELEADGVPESHLHVVAGLTRSLDHLPKATIWQRTELAHGIEWGIGLGGVAGLTGSLLAVAFPPAGLVLGMGSVLWATAAGAGFGAVVTALIGSREHNRKLDSFHRALSSGQFLLMVDIPRKQVQPVSDAILRHHPEAEVVSIPAAARR